MSRWRDRLGAAVRSPRGPTPGSRRRSRRCTRAPQGRSFVPPRQVEQPLGAGRRRDVAGRPGTVPASRRRPSSSSPSSASCRTQPVARSSPVPALAVTSLVHQGQAAAVVPLAARSSRPWRTCAARAPPTAPPDSSASSHATLMISSRCSGATPSRPRPDHLGRVDPGQHRERTPSGMPSSVAVLVDVAVGRPSRCRAAARTRSAATRQLRRGVAVQVRRGLDDDRGSTNRWAKLLPVPP